MGTDARRASRREHKASGASASAITREGANGKASSSKEPDAPTWPKYVKDIIRELIIGLALLGVGYYLVENNIAERQERAEEQRFEQAERFEKDRFEQAEVLENIRFVRDRSDDPTSKKPFADMDLHGARLSGLRWDCTQLESVPEETCATFVGANLSGAILNDASFIGASMHEANLSNTQAEQAHFNAAILLDANLEDAALSRSYFVETQLSGANLTDATLTDAYMSDAFLYGANLEGATFDGAIISGTDLSNANLSGADLSGADFTGATDEAGMASTELPLMEDICYTAATRWPAGFEPPQEPNCANW